MADWIIWIIIGGVFIIGEIATLGFMLILPGIAALLTSVFCLTGLDLYAQIIFFCILSIVLLVFIKPILKSSFAKNVNKSKVSSDQFSIVGKIGYVTEAIDIAKNKGLVKIGGDVWSATSDENIEIDAAVCVVDIIGVKAKVERIKE